jgi:RNA polymerase sigma-70 factor, ECF subfamily
MNPLPRQDSIAPPGDELAELAARARLGDQSAFQLLYRRCARSVHAVLAARLSAQEAEDRVQEVFLKAWRARGELREPARVGSWLLAIARREAVAALRARTKDAELPDALADVRCIDQDRGELGALVLAELRALPEAYRETLALRLLGEHSGDEISALTGLTPGSVRVNLSKGMQLLRERLQRRGLP